MIIEKTARTVKAVQRNHIKVGDIDKYPELEPHIEYAATIATSKYPGPADREKWNRFFHRTATKILKKKGLRV